MSPESELAWHLPEPGGPMPLAGLRVAISISASPDLERLGFSEPHLRQAMIHIARYLLAAGATLAYGGDLRRQGYTEALIDMVKAHHRAGDSAYQRVDSYLSWPLYLSLDPRQEAENIDEVRFIRVEPPADLALDPSRPLAADDERDAYVRARCFTALREAMNRDLHARILLGGQVTGYKGKYPGLAEEAYLALSGGKALFLLGAFGGCTGELIGALRGQIPEKLTWAFQSRDNAYTTLVRTWNREASGRPFGGAEPAPIDYDLLLAFFRNRGLTGLGNGLTAEDNERLFTTVFLPESVRLLLAGLKHLASGATLADAEVSSHDLPV